MCEKTIRTALLAAIVAVAGCSSILSKPYPEKTRYAFAAPMPTDARPAGALQPLRIATIRAYPPYDGLSLVYKTGASTFTSDYYNTFVAQPDRLLAGEVEGYLSRCGIFSTVRAGELGDSRYLLEADLLQLYGDFVKNSKPAAVISMRFFLIDDDNAAAKVLLQKVYRHSEPLSASSADALLDGWNRGLAVILKELAGDIEAATREGNTKTAEQTKP